MLQYIELRIFFDISKRGREKKLCYFRVLVGGRKHCVEGPFLGNVCVSIWRRYIHFYEVYTYRMYKIKYGVSNGNCHLIRLFRRQFYDKDTHVRYHMVSRKHRNVDNNSKQLANSISYLSYCYNLWLGATSRGRLTYNISNHICNLLIWK